MTFSWSCSNSLSHQHQALPPSQTLCLPEFLGSTISSELLQSGLLRTQAGHGHPEPPPSMWAPWSVFYYHPQQFRVTGGWVLLFIELVCCPTTPNKTSSHPIPLSSISLYFYLNSFTSLQNSAQNLLDFIFGACFSSVYFKLTQMFLIPGLPCHPYRTAKIPRRSGCLWKERSQLQLLHAYFLLCRAQPHLSPSSPCLD